MSVRPPRQFAPKSLPQDPITAAIDHEIRGEMAGTLGRLLQHLEKTLAAANAADETDPQRDEKLDAAANALWHVVIQRELCGFRNTERFMRDYGIPASIRYRMGIARTPR